MLIDKNASYTSYDQCTTSHYLAAIKLICILRLYISGYHQSYVELFSKSDSGIVAFLL